MDAKLPLLRLPTATQIEGLSPVRCQGVSAQHCASRWAVLRAIPSESGSSCPAVDGQSYASVGMNGTLQKTGAGFCSPSVWSNGCVRF